MNIEEAYNELEQKSLNLDSIPEINSLRNECLNQNDFNHYYKLTNLIIEILIDVNRLNEALELSLEIFEKINPDEYLDVYSSILDKIVYIYITKQYYQRALKMCIMKKDIIDANNTEQVNRWRLELSYIHEAIGEQNEALTKLVLILDNNPTLELKALVLSNITKIFIDNNNLTEGRCYLDQGYELAKQINDVQGIRYCEYLEGKILRLEKNYKKSYQILSQLVKNIVKIDSEMFIYLNEYLLLLNEMGLYNEGYKTAKEYYEKVSNCDDLQNKLSFYRNCLRLEVGPMDSKKKKNSPFSTHSLIEKISTLEEEILKNKDIKSTEVKEDEVLFESKNSEKEVATKVKDGIKSLVFKNEDVHNLLLSYSNSLVNHVPMDEILFVIFDKNVNNILPLLPNDNTLMTTYQYKNNRLYERKLRYNEISNTFLDTIFETQSEFAKEITKSSPNFIDPISKDDYYLNKFKYLYATPLFNQDMMFGACIYLSKSNALIDVYPKSFLSITSNILSLNLVNQFYKESVSLEKDLFEKVTSNLELCLFYYNDNNKKLILSGKLKQLLGFTKYEINLDEYNSIITSNDLKDYSVKYEYITNLKNYSLSYHIKIKNDNVLFRENASPIVINNNNYFVGTIERVNLDNALIDEVKKTRIQDIHDLKSQIQLLKGKPFVGLVIKNKHYQNSFDLDKIDNDLYQLFLYLKDKTSNAIYYHNNIFTILFENETIKNVLKLGKEINNDYKVTYSIISYPDVLVRIDDFIDISYYILDQAKEHGYIIFNNDIYATYISITTITNCVSKQIASKSVCLYGQNVTYINDNDSFQLLGYYVTPNILGVYDNQSLKSIDNDLKCRLDEYVINELTKKDFISIYSLSNISLMNVLNNNIIKRDSKLVFYLSNGLYINEIIEKIKQKSLMVKLIITKETFNNISIGNLLNNNDIILGFDSELNDTEYKTISQFIKRFYTISEKSLRISKNSIKL